MRNIRLLLDTFLSDIALVNMLKHESNNKVLPYILIDLIKWNLKINLLYKKLYLFIRRLNSKNGTLYLTYFFVSILITKTN